jgi:hypothetical protein
MFNSFMIHNINRSSNSGDNSYSEPQYRDPSMVDRVGREINKAEYGFSAHDW